MPDCPFEEIHEDGYELAVANSFNVRFVPSAKGATHIVVGGPCPRCEHAMTYTHPLLIIRGVEDVTPEMAEGLWELARAQGHAPSQWSFDAYCECHVKHEKAPADATGCGAYWGMTAEAPSR